MRNEKYIKWLYSELPELMESGVIDADTTQRLKSHFGEVDETPAYNMAFIIAGSLGAVLIGGGIIMLFAYNWENFSISMRTVLSFLPLIIAQIIYGYVFFNKRESAAWVEASSGFLMLMLASTIALISQTYNIEGSMESFLFSWMLLSIPLLYLMNASLPALFYMVGISSWAVHEGGDGNVFYWVFLAAVLPHLYLNIKKDQPTVRANLLGWVFMATFSFAWFNVIESRVDEKLLVGTAILLSLAYFIGQRIYPSSENGILRPFRTFAIAGIFIMTMILGYEWPNDWSGMDTIVRGQNYQPWVAMVNLGIIVVALLALIYFIFSDFRQNKLRHYWVATFPLMIIAGLVFVHSGWELAAIILANFFLLGFGIYYIREGIHIRKLSLINVGMLFLTAMIIARFFDADLSLVWKGIVFILLGIGFLSVNIIMNRRLKEGLT